jgi:hypothetical protein
MRIGVTDRIPGVKEIKFICCQCCFKTNSDARFASRRMKNCANSVPKSRARDWMFSCYGRVGLTQPGPWRRLSGLPSLRNGKQVGTVPGLGHGLCESRELLSIYVTGAEGDFLRAAHFEPLPGLDGLYEGRCLEQ